MTIKLAFISLAASMLFCSCLNQKFLAKKQVVFKVVESNATTGEKALVAYTNGDKMKKVSVDESNGTLFIKKAKDETDFVVKDTLVRNFIAKGAFYTDLELTGKIYFPETTFPKPNVINNNQSFFSPSRLTYVENKIVLQAMSIPIKIRPAINRPRFKDSLPTQVETGFNAGFAVGLKRTWSIFKTSTNIFGQNTTRLSVASGVLFNLGGADVKKLTTNYTISVERKELFYSYGVFLMFGFNNINLGYSLGGDHLFSDRRKNWVYEGKLWHGITVALDILK